MRKVLIFTMFCVTFACSTDDGNEGDNNSTLKISGQKYTFDRLLMSDASAFPLSDPEMKTHYFYLTQEIPCDSAPCSRPIGMYVKVVTPMNQALLVGTYSFGTQESPYAFVYDYKNSAQSISGGIQIAFENGQYELTFLENTMLSQNHGLTGKVKGNFQIIPFDYRTANGQWN
ncbi:MAG: hypothetical protein EOO50_06000 [Flavobacterium sp.]|uniref:hypothetical protein n=1 Tax=Flavobacterium sp. TaxID=239 RepID=UPI00121223D2|nr:hypothetical protein [Flavobacterium sp.]RZJ67294.1 MAG: hypothetical protein EOO50_06000 [Flavobacterium sp.]